MNKSKYHYRIVHTWLNKHHGKANKCECGNCSNKTERYEYALKRGYKHDRKRDNYLMLCRSCHRRYDLTKEQKNRLISQIAGKYNENLKLGPVSKIKKVVRIDRDKVEKKYKSGVLAAKDSGVNKTQVYMVANGQRKTANGYIFIWV